MKRSLGLVAACLVLSACGSAVPLSNPGGPLERVPPSPVAFHFPTASNRAFARRDVQKVLHIVVLPSSARALTKAPAGAPRWLRDQFAHPRGASPGVAEARGVWLVREPLAQVMRFIRSHAKATPHMEIAYPLYARGAEKIGSRPEGDFVFAPVPGRSWSRYLSFGVTPLHHGSTIVSVDAQESWTRALPRTAVLTSRVKRIDITSRYGNGPKAVLVHVRSPFAVGSIVSWANGLSDGPVSVCFGYFGTGPLVTLTFRSATGRVLARAHVNAPYVLPLSGPCNPLSLTIGNRPPVELIGSDLLVRIERLLGIDVAPVSPSLVASCLRHKGWTVRMTYGPPPRIVARYRGRTWTISFPASGKVATHPASTRVLADCLRAPQFSYYR